MTPSKITRMLGLAGQFFQRSLHMQVGALCLRETPNGREVLLVSSLTTKRWIIPKGWPMPDRSAAGAAMQEAWEEAGVRGEAGQTEVGRYVYQKTRKDGLTIPCEVHVFRIEVSMTAKDYPEMRKRKRKWVTPARAAELVDEPGLRDILRAL